MIYAPPELLLDTDSGLENSVIDRLRRAHPASKAAVNMNSATRQRPVATFLKDFRETGGLRGTDIANFSSVSKATVSRWSNDHKSPRPATELALSDLHYVVMRLGEFYNPEEVRTWLYAIHPQLNGERAMVLIRENRTKEVLEVISRLESDVYL